jgi:hypothetical protein
MKEGTTMTILLAVDDGLTNSNYNWADIFFLVGTILAVLAALTYIPRRTNLNDPPPAWFGWGGVLAALALASTAFGLFLL